MQEETNHFTRQKWIQRYGKLALLIGILLGAVLAQRMGWIDFSVWHGHIESHADQWWAPVALIFLKTLMYAFALPASTLILLAGSLYAPLTATVITVIGGVLGAFCAYALARFLSPDFVRQRTQPRGMELLRNHAGFLELCALRSLPGFPHSLLNYGAGALRIGIWIFAASTVIGLTIKGYVYTAAVYAQMQAGSATDRISWERLWPLAVWAVLLIIGAALKRAWHAE